MMQNNVSTSKIIKWLLNLLNGITKAILITRYATKLSSKLKTYIYKQSYSAMIPETNEDSYFT
jgi:hypothetical protein